jgi:hypothetical protein
MDSLRWRLNIKDLHRLKRGFIIAFCGAMLTFLQELKFDFGNYTPLVVMFNSVLINLLRLWIAGK